MSIVFLVQNLAQASDSVGYDCIFQYKILKEHFGNSEDIRIFADVFNQSLHPGIPIHKMSEFWDYIEKYPESHIIYHFCDGWDRIDDFLRDKAKNAIIRWHNNTPPWLYVNGNVDFAEGCNRGFNVIAGIARAGTVRFLVNSEFTRRQLHALDGLDSHIDTVFPGSTFLLKDEAAAETRFAPAACSDAIDLLFVGRVVPHKGHRHILSVAATVQRFSGKRVRVTFVGALERRLEDYRSELDEIAIRLGIEVIFTGLVTDEELSQIYQTCNVFICMSEHEGFGMPVFEAMRSRVPVVAWASSAMSDLLAGHPFASGEFDIHRFAACVLASLDEVIRQRIIAFQETILRQYTRKTVRAQLLDAVARARNADMPTKPEPAGAGEEMLEDVVAFVTSLTEWIEQEIGASIETFDHDASINYMGLYDIAVHKRLIEFIRSGNSTVSRNETLRDVGEIGELHQGHAVIREVMVGGETPSTRPASNLDELLSFDDDVFVRVACRTLLGREADPGLVASYLRRLRKGADKIEIVRELSGSKEGRRRGSIPGMEDIDSRKAAPLLRVENAVARLGRYLLPGTGNLPPYHPMGSIHHVDDLLRLNDVAFVDTSYHILLGRAADPGGLDHYVKNLRQGMPRRRVLADLAGTEAARTRVNHLEGLVDFLAERHQESDISLPAMLAKLENELGRLTNQLVAQAEGATGASLKPEPPAALLRLAERASVDAGARRPSAAPDRSSDVAPTPGDVSFDYVHQILITADGLIPESMPDMVQHNIDSIQHHHREAEYRLWGSDDLRVMIARHFDADVLHAFDSLQAFALKADLARYCLLYVYGGLYSDLSNRFLSRWRIGTDKVIACFRDHKPLHGAVWMNQNTIIYAPPAQPEIKLAIDLVLENVRNREYGVSSLAPSGPVLFGRVVAAVGRADRYHIGEAINMQVEGGLNRSCYVDDDGSLVAVRLQGGGGKPVEIGLRGTNVYGEMWDKRKIYGEGLMFLSHDYPNISTNAPKNEHGIQLRGQNKDWLRSTVPTLPRGLYLATWRFSEIGNGSLGVKIQTIPSHETLLVAHDLSPDASGRIRVVLPLEGAADLEFEARGTSGFQGVFKDFTVERLSPDPTDRTVVPDFSSDTRVPATAGQRVADIPYIHHIAYEDGHSRLDERDYIAENMRIARELHPGARQMLWSRSSLREMIAAQFSADVVQAFDRLRTASHRSELARYCLIHSMGGLYVDPWLRMVNPIDVPQSKAIACFRSARVEQGASWSVDTGLLYAAAGCAEIGQLIEQIAESVLTDTYGVMPSSVTGAERLGRLLAVTYDARHYFSGETVSITRGPSATSEAFLSQDGRLIAVRKGPDGPSGREQNDAVQAWHKRLIYSGSTEAQSLEVSS